MSDAKEPTEPVVAPLDDPSVPASLVPVPGEYNALPITEEKDLSRVVESSRARTAGSTAQSATSGARADLIRRLAKGFAQEWLRPNDPAAADEGLVRTLTTAMAAFYAAAHSAEERAGAVAPAPPRNETDRSEVEDRSEDRLLLEMQLVAYAVLGFRPDQEFKCRPHVQEAVEGIIEMVREKDGAPAPPDDVKCAACGRHFQREDWSTVILCPGCYRAEHPATPKAPAPPSEPK